LNHWKNLNPTEGTTMGILRFANLWKKVENGKKNFVVGGAIATIALTLTGCQTPNQPSPNTSTQLPSLKLSPLPSHLVKDNKIVIQSYLSLRQGILNPNSTEPTENIATEALSPLASLSPQAKDELSKYYQQNCEKGNAQACIIAGLLEESSSFYEKGCLKGDVTGCRLTALFYKKILNTQEALNFYEKGCQMGDAVSCLKGAEIASQTGQKEKAHKLLQEGCKLKNQIACRILGK
jgi:TPR repeat protein